MATMKAIDIKDGKGPIENLYMTSIPRPKISGSKALIKVKAFGLNRMDTLQREGKYPVPPQAPSTMGVEFSGTIEELADSPEVEQSFKVGDEVFGLAYGGAYAEYIAVSTHMLIHKPKELSWEEAAGIPEVWITALQAMYLIGEFKDGKSILWHAGASSVSIAGQQLSKVNGASKVFATARSDEKVKFCVEKLGSTAAFNTKTTKNWDEEVRKATEGKGVDIIVDYIGPDTFGRNLNAAARDARIVNLASLSGTAFNEENMKTVNFGNFVAKRLRFEGSSLRSRDETYQGKLRDQLVEHALPMFKDGRLKCVIEKVYDWKDIQEAHRQMEANETMGKLICVIPGA
ncbi:Quinone oxidoreductase PIG3 [Pseudocercospora fuligena]|uniref:Quinone oxidoreductase PIG3 n=1 Tax=Pseudocercospora fuligena TaxID=685502 RepID=A0A8H6RQ14_9PEZI|nr:Quinone oxidoreductase PIG3 [Pseudocercospora fuligena]